MTIVTRKQKHKQEPIAQLETIWEYHIVMQSNELDPKTGVPEDTQEFVAPFFGPQNETSLSKKYDGWINQEAGYHLVTFNLREFKAKFSGDLSYRSVCFAPGHECRSSMVEKVLFKDGLGRILWKKERKSNPQLPPTSPKASPLANGEITRQEWLNRFGHPQTQKV